MKTNVLIFSFLALLGGCAGSPIAVANDPARKDVEVAGAIYSVAPYKNGFIAMHRDWAAHNILYIGDRRLQMKRDLSAAIEKATGCKIIDSVMDEAATSMHADVKC
jgi:hypothetical protein